MSRHRHRTSHTCYVSGVLSPNKCSPQIGEMRVRHSINVAADISYDFAKKRSLPRNIIQMNVNNTGFSEKLFILFSLSSIPTRKVAENNWNLDAASSSTASDEVDEIARNVNDSRKLEQIQPRLHKPAQQKSTVEEINTCRFPLEARDQETADNRCKCYQMVFSNSFSCGPAIYHRANIDCG